VFRGAPDAQGGGSELRHGSAPHPLHGNALVRVLAVRVAPARAWCSRSGWRPRPRSPSCPPHLPPGGAWIPTMWLRAYARLCRCHLETFVHGNMDADEAKEVSMALQEVRCWPWQPWRCSPRKPRCCRRAGAACAWRAPHSWRSCGPSVALAPALRPCVPVRPAVEQRTHMNHKWCMHSACNLLPYHKL